MMKLHDKGWIPVSGHWDDKKGATRMTKKEHWDDRRRGYSDNKKRLLG
ncbi:hypothetical protein [Wolbachia endosymbiont (group A) of Sphaerophoria taeniata]|nr:hypothetical protein [Wolbachia endosymbiont (group A) of Sphaerophoria taeniata]